MRIGFGQSLVHNVDQVAVFATNVDPTFFCAYGQGGNQNAFNQLVRVELNQQPVFAGAWFRFIGIHNNVFRLVQLTGHKTPFHAGWKSCSTTTAQGGSFHFINDLILRHADRFFQSHITLVSKICID